MVVGEALLEALDEALVWRDVAGCGMGGGVEGGGWGGGESEGGEGP